MQKENKMKEVQKVLEEISSEYGDAIITHISDYEYDEIKVKIFLNPQYQYTHITLNKWKDMLGAWIYKVSIVKNTLVITYHIK